MSRTGTTLSLTAAALAASTLIGCGQDASTAAPPETPETPTSTTAPTPEPTPEPGPAPTNDAPLPIATSPTMACAGGVTCVIEEGAVDCWGGSAQEAAPPSGSGFESLAVEDGRACALTNAGVVHCWGRGRPEAVVPGPPVAEIALGGGRNAQLC